MTPEQIIRRPIVLTEKANLLREKNNQVVFEVARGANKVEIKDAVQKLFNAMLLATETVQGNAVIDDPAAKYLVAANGKRVAPGAAFARVTLRNLATHTASLPDNQPNAPERDGYSLYRDEPMPASMMAYLNAWMPPYPPGTRYSYSNLGFVVLAHVATTLADRLSGISSSGLRPASRPSAVRLTT